MPETRTCPKCGAQMIRRRTGVLLLVRPALPSFEWWCGCGHREPVQDEPRQLTDAEARAEWERVNAEPEG